MIQITYASPANSHQNSVKTSQTDIQAVYVQAWLASKLKWSLISVEQEAGSMRVAYKHDHSALTISLVPKDTGLIEPGAIYSFEVMTQSDYHYLISHENDNKLVKVHASNPERCEMPYTIFLNNYQNGPAMVSESIYQAPSEHYVSMLSSLGSAMWDHI